MDDHGRLDILPKAGVRGSNPLGRAIPGPPWLCPSSFGTDELLARIMRANWRSGRSAEGLVQLNLLDTRSRNGKRIQELTSREQLALRV